MGAPGGIHDIVGEVPDTLLGPTVETERRLQSLGPSHSAGDATIIPDDDQVKGVESAYLRGMALDDLIILPLVLYYLSDTVRNSWFPVGSHDGKFLKHIQSKKSPDNPSGSPLKLWSRARTCSRIESCPCVISDYLLLVLR